MNTKIAVIITVLVMLSLGMAVFILKDYVTIGNPTGEEEVAQDAAEDALPEGEGAETTLVAAATTAAGGTTVAGATTVAPVTTVGSATTAAGATTVTTSVGPTTTSGKATTAAPVTTTTQTFGALTSTTTQGGLGGIVTTTGGIGAIITTTGTLAQIGDINITAGKPDLLVSTPPRITGSDTVKPNEDVWLTYVTVTNLGTAASGPCKYGYYLSSSPTLHVRGRHLIEGNIPGLQPGKSATITALSVRIPSQWSPGTYYIGIYVDDHLTVDELNENNNYGTVQITVK